MNANLAKILISNLNCFVVGPVKSSSGTIVPFYFEFRKLYSNPKALKAVAQLMSQIIKKMKVDIIAGAETAGIPLATAISLETKIPFVYIKKKRKEFLTKKYVEGEFKKNALAVLIDDTLLYGRTKQHLINNARHDGLIVNNIFVIYISDSKSYANSEERYWFKQKKINIRHLLARKVLTKFFVDEKLIPANTAQVDKYYAADPVGWSRNRKYWQEFLVWKQECKKLGLL